MRVVAGFTLITLLSGISVFAQTAASPGGSNRIQPGAANTICGTRLQLNDENHAKGGSETTCVTVFVPGCPIDMRVRQGIDGGMLAVDKNGEMRLVFEPRLSLSLNDLRPGTSGPKMVSAIVTVRGTGGKAHIQPLHALPASRSDSASRPLVRTLNVDLADWGQPGVSGDFRLPGFTSARQIELQSVTYEDGSTWKPSGNETCRVAPDPIMLINR